MRPRCHVSNCLGHADERTAEVTCSRCQGQRGILVRPASAPDPSYVCARCTRVLAGYVNVKDPLASPEVRARLQEITRRRLAGMTSDSSVPGAAQEPGGKGEQVPRICAR
jgi:hypothetical protein